MDCIYSNERIVVNDYADKHFLPYAFVSHDLIMNLISANKSFNSSKSDRLPPLEQFFDPYFKLQKSTLEIIQYKSPGNKYLEDYLTIVPDLALFDYQRVLEQIQPMATIAHNNGFELLNLHFKNI